MVDGSFNEDYADVDRFGNRDSGGKRSLNHFYDPLDTHFDKGLSDYPPDLRITAGTNSFIWASISNGLGFNFHDPLHFGSNLGTSNIWSWQNARGYEWLGLTAPDKLGRQTNLDNMFRAVGQVMHLLEDASQPQHVRNEQHLYPTNTWFYNTFFWHSPIEEWGRTNVDHLYYGDGSMLNWTNAGFTKLEDFWDRHLYAPGSAAVLNAAEHGGAQLGLAEWCNGNFLGDRHLYAESFKPTSIKYYPHPSLKDTTQPQINPKNLAGTVIDTVSLENHKQGQRVYLAKTNAGVTVTHHSVLTYFAVQHTRRMDGPSMGVSLTIRDENVLSNYHAILIPKAVKYSAGLLDYYFRGTIATSISEDANLGGYVFGVTNTSSQAFYQGNFYLLSEYENGDRAIVQTNPLTQPLPSGGAVNIAYSGVLGNKMLVVYKGTIGVSGTTALDPVDKDIAIAATIAPHFEPLRFDFMSLYSLKPYTGASSPYNSAPTYLSPITGPTGWRGNWTDPGTYDSPMAARYSVETVIETGNDGSATTTVNRRLPYWVNPVDPVSAGGLGENYPPDDLRITGFPLEGAAIATANSSSGSATSPLNGEVWGPSTPGQQFFDQGENVNHPPDWSVNSVTHRYNATGFDGAMAAAAEHPPRAALLTRQVIHSEYPDMSPSYGAQLIPNTLVQTREGPIYFGYMGVDCTVPEHNLVPPGARYGAALLPDGVTPNPNAGKYQISGLPTGSNSLGTFGALLGLTVGDNEPGSIYNCFPNDGTVISMGQQIQVAPGYFDPNTGLMWGALITPVRVAMWDKAMLSAAEGAGADISGIRETMPFQLAGTTLVLQGGVPGALVTAVVSVAKCNRIIAFPLSTGTVITIAANSPQRTVNADAPLTLLPACNAIDFADGSGRTASGPGGFVANIAGQGVFCSESRIRIPPNPDVAKLAYDITFFRDIGAHYLDVTAVDDGTGIGIFTGENWPTTYMLQFQTPDPWYAPHAATVTHRATLAAGEYIFGTPGFPSWVQFGKPSQIP